jgi:S1-C subfamily serine protease
MRLRTLRMLIVFALVAVIEVRPVYSQVARDLPEDNLAYPVFIGIGTGTGTGFLLRTDRNIFLVTARHVLYDPVTKRLRDPMARLEAPSRNPNESVKAVLEVQLSQLEKEGNLRADAAQDVAAIRVAGYAAGKSTGNTPGVVDKSTPVGGVVVVPHTNTLRFADVFVSNPIVVFGYPTSIGIPQVPQIDFSRPLLRSGIVAGLNGKLRTIIIDAAVNPGNSGGPVLLRSPNGALRIIGLVTQLVPALIDTIPPGPQKVQSNSGYAVVASMDGVLDLITALER